MKLITTKLISKRSFNTEMLAEVEKYLDDPDFTKVTTKTSNLHKTSIIKATKDNGTTHRVVIVGLSSKEMQIDETTKEGRNLLIVILHNKEIIQEYIAIFFDVSQSLVSNIVNQKGT